MKKYFKREIKVFRNTSLWYNNFIKIDRTKSKQGMKMKQLEQIEIIQSNRKTMAIQVKKTGQVVVRAPYWMKKADIYRLVEQREAWIKKHLKQLEEEQNNQIDEEEIKELVQKAKIQLPQKVSFYAKKLGVTYGRITIRHQKTRWGSCSSKGNLNFNCLLMKAPEEVQDYIVVHELCHRKQMNHSKKFWDEVEKILPEYKKQEKWLKTIGRTLI